MAWTLTAVSFASHESRDPGARGCQPGAAFDHHEREPAAEQQQVEQRGLAEMVRQGVHGQRVCVLHGCRAAGFEPRIAFGSDDYNAVQAFVAVGLGVAMLPRLALLVMRPGLHRVGLADPPVRRIAAAQLATSYRSAATASMLSVLKETADAFTAP